MKTVLSASALALILTGCASTPSSKPAPDLPFAGPGNGMVCKSTTGKEIAALFDRWNASLQTHDPEAVAENYAPRALLLPTVSNKPRFTNEERIDYFEHFLHNKPVGKIDQRWLWIGCNTAIDAGLYSFTFGTTGQVVHARYSFTYEWNGREWLITSHHSSGMPEK
ncbi:SgcJ/EcaC family oxidoreductase [Herbaspirillum huttiense]|uniref:SgcJ/EcaC family oxidoreductase n=1 Tax=Herbaspirillum huttiense TaxID=863372 RepID=UPI002176AEA7|nr:SgcJ/EcaC family oxidoreductase [Herbaspirillum huttiense]UWE14502.1 SgcJ/EcaC family oxidoreductase [Herbaspirillum huttiense]